MNKQKTIAIIIIDADRSWIPSVQLVYNV